jgi:hypothetical protein
MDPPIIARDRLNSFISDVFHNFSQLHAHHRKLLNQLHEIQRREHPTISSITASVFNAALNFREAYMEYVPNYPIAAYRVDDEMANNIDFKMFVEVRICFSLTLYSWLTDAHAAMYTAPRCSSAGHEELHLPSYPSFIAI